MEISVTQTEGLGRRMTVAIPHDDVEKQIAKRIQSIATTARIDGFRPGKAPLKVVQRRYGEQVLSEVSHDVVQRSFYNAISQEKLRPVGQPFIEHTDFRPGEAFTFTATFEIYPEIEVKVPSDLTIEKPVVEVTDADVDRVIDRLREQNKVFEVVERASADGDQVNIDFVGSLDNEKFDGGEAVGYDVVLGSRSLVGDFEKNLTGKKAGEKTRFDVVFPEKYPAPNLAGKTAQFDVTINRVSAPKLPEVDDAFAQLFGVSDGVDSLRTQVRDNIGRQVAEAVESKVKSQVVEALLAANPIDVPKGLVDNEINARVNRAVQEMSRQGLSREQLNLKPDMFAEPSRKSVAVGLLIADVMRRQNIAVSPQELREAVEHRAQTFENPPQVVQWYYENRKQLADLEALVLEDKAINWIVAQAKIKENPTTVKELIEEP